MHFTNFTHREPCFDKTWNQEVICRLLSEPYLHFELKRKLFLEPPDLLVIHGSVYGGLLNSPWPHLVCLDRALSGEIIKVMTAYSRQQSKLDLV